MPTYVSPFTGTVVTPTDVTYYALSFSTDQTLAWEQSVNPPEAPAARIMDCAASMAGLTVISNSSGKTIKYQVRFLNLGSKSITLA